MHLLLPKQVLGNGYACVILFRKIPIDSVVDLWPSHLTYIPSFVSTPFVQREKNKYYKISFAMCFSFFLVLFL